MSDAKHARLYLAADLSSATLRARAQRRRETAERIWDDRLERLLLEEADDLEDRAAALEAGAVIEEEEPEAAGPVVLPDLAALREEP